MRIYPVRSRLIVALLVTLTFPVIAGAGGIIFKDGFTLRGRVKREGDTVFDPSSGQQVPVGKGFWLIDDSVRHVIFSLKQVQDVIEDEKDAGATDLVVLTRPFARLKSPAEVKYIEEIVEIKPFDDKWNRDFKFVPDTGKPEIARQALVYLSPYAARVESRGHALGCTYFTREWEPEAVRNLLYNHPDLANKGAGDLKKRLTVARFLRQAGWYDEAEVEYDRILKDMPGKAKEIEEAKSTLVGLRAEQQLVEIERAMNAGRYGWARAQLDKFPRDGADDKQVARMRTLKTKLDASDEAVSSARRYLKEVLARLSSGEGPKTFELAVTDILAELHPDNVARLETFTKYAEQDERERKADKKPTQTTPQLLSLALSGWLLGSSAAEAKPEVALKLWRARQFVQDYQKTATAGTRDKLLTNYEKEGAVAFDEMALLISTLPPPDAEEKPPVGVAEMEVKTPSRRKSVPYLLQLPPEYHPGRPYPVLLVLSHSEEKARVMLDRFSEQAADHGFILAAPDWSAGLGKSYGHTVDEQTLVFDVLRDLQRRFNVDTDRVFLDGYGEGGVMAFDVGLSRPDLFAGVLPFSAAPRLFSTKYRGNAQHLPFYVVSGSMQNNDTAKQIRLQFDTWVARGFPTLWVDYRGRAFEWFKAELLFSFDWMVHKKRSAAIPETGEFQTQRLADHRFYWLSVDGISEKCLNSAANFNNLGQPATVQGKLGENNTVHIHARSVKSVTVWLGRGMVDFEKPVSFTMNTQARFSRKLTPSLSILLEDFYQRGDRQRLYLAKVDVTP